MKISSIRSALLALSASPRPPDLVILEYAEEDARPVGVVRHPPKVRQWTLRGADLEQTIRVERTDMRWE